VIGADDRFELGKDFGFGEDLKHPNNGSLYLRITNKVFDYLKSKGKISQMNNYDEYDFVSDLNYFMDNNFYISSRENNNRLIIYHNNSTKNEIAPSPLSSLENAASAQNRQGSKQQKQYEMRVMELETALEDMQRKLDDKAQHNVELDKELAEVRFRAFDHVNLLGLLQARFECAFTRERIDLYCIIT
jgi:galactokinase